MSATIRALLAGRTLARGPGGRALASAIFHTGVLEACPPCEFAELLDTVDRHQPQVVVLSLDDAAAEGLSAIEAVMAHRPVPIVVVCQSGSNRQDAIRALAAGALEIAELTGHPDGLAALHRQVKFLSKVKVVRHLKGRRRQKKPESVRPAHPVVAIAASLGGPKALAKLLSGLPLPFRAPVALCQHITTGFADDLARYLAVETRHDVVEARDGDRLLAGRIYVAPSEKHLAFAADGGHLELGSGPAVGGFKPSCDVLLKSAAAVFGAQAIGVVLTGMGNDGARGLKEIRARGGHTIAQDQASSVVFGMPGEAIALGAAEKVLPLDGIAAQLAAWVQR